MPDWSALAARGLDAVVLHGPLDTWPDAKNVLDGAWMACDASSRLVLVHDSGFWLRCRRWVTGSPPDVDSLLRLARFEPVATQQRVLIPIRIPLVCDWVNRWLAPLPLLRSICVTSVMVARPLKRPREALSVSIIVPARNEAGTIDALVRRLPEMGADDELIFVEGHSTDGTWEAIQRAIAAKGAGRRITAVRQPGAGKADAVRHGFELATRDLLMILDADLTVPPEELPLFYRAIASDAAEFVTGNRLIYAMDPGAMQSANVIGNKFFARALSYLLGQPIGDPLCGTKVLRRTDYDRLRRQHVSKGRVCPPVSFIKIDTQGAEMRVLLGARSTLRRTRPALWIELDAAALAAQGSTPDEVVGLLDREGYAPYDVGVWSGIRPLTPERVVRWCRTTPYLNVLFLPVEAGGRRPGACRSR
jgi:hypothetical protein